MTGERVEDRNTPQICGVFHMTGMSLRTQGILGRRRGAKWYYTAAPPTGNGPGPEL